MRWLIVTDALEVCMYHCHPVTLIRSNFRLILEAPPFLAKCSINDYAHALQAERLIRARLEETPAESRLWCTLGDLNLDDACYSKAWVLSVCCCHETQYLKVVKEDVSQSVHIYESDDELWSMCCTFNQWLGEFWFTFSQRGC